MCVLIISVCFFVHGLIATTVMGAEILEEMGWTTTRTALGTTNGICLPTDITRFAHVSQLPVIDRMTLRIRYNPGPERTLCLIDRLCPS